MNLSSWTKGRVDEFFVLQRGFDITEAAASEGNIPVISSSGFSYFHSEVKVSGPGVVTGRKGRVGPVYYIEEDHWPHDTTLWVKDFKGNLPKYVYYFLQSIKLERYNEALAVPTLNRNNVHAIKCAFPPLKEQEKIVDAFSLWDNAIEKTEALIAAKKKQFEWLTSNLINRAGHKRTAASGLMTEVSKRNKNSTIGRVLSVTNHSGFVLPEEQFERRVASANVSNYKVVEQGQYAYNPSRINVGSIARLDDWENGILSPMYVVFKLDTKKVCSDYFLHWLNSSEARQRIKNSAQGSVRETVSFKDLGAIDVPLPAMDVQKDVTYKLNLAQKEISLLKNTLEQYRSQKRGLMQKLLTGEWHVNSAQLVTEGKHQELTKEASV